jgi:prepilin-type N-terminal cleavage/methylation domain-containing protein
MRMNSKGFTLIEMLVVIALLAIIMIGLLNLLDTSSKISVVETELADTQENVRFAAYHIMRTARMMGSSAMPFAANSAGSDSWFAGELISNASGTVTTDLGNFAVAPGSDVLTLRGFFEIAPFFVDRSAVGTTAITVEESSGGVEINPNFDNVDHTTLEGRGVFLMGRMDQNQYAVGQIAAGSTKDPVTSAPNRQLVIQYGAGSVAWSGLNPSGISVTGGPPFDVYRVGVMESYTYYVAPDFTLQRLRADNSASGGSSEPVAVNIGSLQVELCVDADNDNQCSNAEWLSAPTVTQAAAGRIIYMRFAVFGRTDREVPDWVEPMSTFQTATGATIADIDVGALNRFAKWRRIEVSAALRNYLF